jgi:hypothetical protein
LPSTSVQPSNSYFQQPSTSVQFNGVGRWPAITDPQPYDSSSASYDSVPKLYNLSNNFVDLTDDIVDTEPIVNLDNYIDKNLTKIVGPPSDYVAKRPPDETESKVDQEIDKNRTNLDYLINLNKL